MSIDYSIVVEKMDTVSTDTVSDAVRRVFWKLVGVDSVTGKSARIEVVDVFRIITEIFTDPDNNERRLESEIDPENFVAYSELTAEIVEAWIRARHTDDMHMFESAVSGKIEILNNIAVNTATTTTLPWSTGQ
jgi:hypothetical protein